MRIIDLSEPNWKRRNTRKLLKEWAKGTISARVMAMREKIREIDGKSKTPNRRR